MTWKAEVDRMLAALSDEERKVLAHRFELDAVPPTNEALLEAVRAHVAKDPLWSAVRKSGAAQRESRLTLTKSGLNAEERLLRAILGEDRPAHEREPVEFDEDE